IGLAAIAAGCGGSAGCSGNAGSGNACAVTSVTVVANPATVPKGKTSNLTATVNSRGTCSGAVTWSATPAGGTLTPSGTTATFSSSTASTYTVSAKSNDDSARSGSATVSVTQPVSDCGIANGTV